MDGLLINTEDIYTEATSKVLKQFGKPPLTWDVKIEMQGLPGQAAAEKLIESYELPITWEEVERLNANFQRQLWHKTAFLPGAAELVRHLKDNGIPIALCTSSGREKFDMKTAHLKHTFDLFDVIVTGDDSRIPKGRGKPFPDIWQLGLKLINEKLETQIKPEECLVFEDGIPGLQGGKAFGAYNIWVPHPEAYAVLGDTEAILEGKGELLKSLNDLDKLKFGI
ncbi:haloacid dehalogenase superfamily protein Ecym_7242 [Eremothecium cymbalariae DBVPG|uniref:Uncharacterized protein n=1 Tax=Eremothecium cymbalariae (strain CBS 270.75 / DBVPG 7215 / KCTC 17166 / NRRL Y-17582) TaxID=931890 RepID=G8JW72_ERECY|nr:hypothetical protein Ecym_7242 [Eremothecium cymbalariae DBVPG\